MSLIKEFREYQELQKEGWFKLDKEAHSYTVWKKDLNSGKLSHKEHLDDEGEVEEWMHKAYGKHVTVLVKQDKTGKEITYTDNGEKFVPIIKKK